MRQFDFTIKMLRHYRVTAALLAFFVVGGMQQVAAQVALPYYEDFSSITAANGLPTVSGGSWARSGTTGLQPTYITNQTTYNRTGRNDTKFITFRYGQPTGGNVYTVGPFSLSAGTTYQVGVYYKADGLSGFGPLSLTYGSGTSVSSQSNTIASVSANITNSPFALLQGTFSVTTAGSYYVGILCEANSTPWYLTLDDFSVEALIPCSGAPTTGTAVSYSPLAVTGFNSDVIANGIGSATTSTTADADGTGWYFLDGSYQYTSTGATPTFALPINGVINSATTPGLRWQMQSATANNSLRLNSSTGGTLTVTTPQTATNLYLLATSGSGSATVDVTINFTNSTTQTFSGVNISDWYGGSPIAAAGIGRVNATNTQDGTSTDPRLYQIALAISSSNQGLNIGSITVTRTSTAGVVHVMGVSAASSTPPAACGGNSFQLTVANPPTTTGLAFQWQDSVASSTSFSNVTTGTGGTTLSYTSPALIATRYYRLRVTCTNSSQVAFSNVVTLNINPPPTVSITTLPSNGNICGGTGSVSLTASGTGTGYSWTPAGGLSATNIANPVATPTTTTTYTVTTTGSNGCPGTASRTVGVYTLPTITARTTNNNFCAGGGTVLSAVDTNFGSTTAPTGYTNGTVSSPTADEDLGTVSFGPLVNTTICGSLSGSIGTATGTIGGYSNFTALPAAKFVAGQNYSFSLTSITCGGNYGNAMAMYIDFNQNGSFGDPGETVHSATVTTSGPHSETGSVFIPINVKLGVTRLRVIVNEGLVSGPQMSPTWGEIEDYSIQFVKTPNVSATSGYAWSPATFLASTTGNSVTASAMTASTTYTVTATDSNGCVGTASVAVNVNPLPTLSVSPATAAICIGGSISLTASGAASYSWSPATGLSATSGATVTASPSLTTTYTITGTSSAGCVNTTTKTVTVNPLPVVAVTPANPSICTGGSVVLTANGATAYSWSPATGLSATSGTSVTANPSSTDIYTVTGTDVNGCSNTASATVTVNPLPTISVSPATAVAFCGSGSATLTASGASTYSWSPSTGLSSTSGTSVTAAPTATTTYTVTGTDANGCINTATKTISVNPVPTISISPSSTPTICAGTSTVLTASGGSTYTWSPATGLSATTGTSVTASPTSTTTYTVTGTDANGCTATASRTVNVQVSPTVSISPATPIAYCAGGSATLTASGNATSYTWSPATGLSSTTGTTVTASPTATTTYTVTGNSANGCTTSVTKTVTVNPLPTIGVSPTGGTAICRGSSVTLTATGAVTYSWSPATGLSATSGSTVSASPSANTTYTITGTDLNGCVNSTTKAITVNTPPTVSISPATATVLCAGASATLTASGASTYSWTPTTGLSSGTAATVTASPSNTTIYSVTGTDGNGCTGTATKTITVNQLPLVSISPSTAVAVCSGTGATLTASGANTYTWTPTAGLSPTTGATVTATPTFSTTYTVTGTDGNGCSNTASRLVTVLGRPTIGTFVAGGVTTICPGISVNITATGAVSYVWTPSGSLSSPVGTTVTATPLVTTTYTVTGTAANGCTNTATRTITVRPAPVSDITPGGYRTICQNDSLVLSATPGYLTYQWMIYGVTLVPATRHTLITGTGGIYTLKVTDSSGCISTSAQPTVITVEQRPTPVITQNGASLVTNPGYLTYTWYRNGVAIPGVTSPIFTPASGGLYTVGVAADSNFCVGLSAPYEYTALNVGNASGIAASIRLYPNPAHDVLNIDAPVAVDVTVSAMDGKIVFRASGVKSIHTANWADGVYQVVIHDKNGAFLKSERLTKAAR